MWRGLVLTVALTAQVAWLAAPAPAGTTTWAIEPTPNPPGGTSALLFGVSCVSAASCTAVGISENSSAITTLAEHWNGSAWAIQATPNPPRAAVTNLVAISCVSAASCTAVGTYRFSSRPILPLAESWNGSTWAIKPVPHPAGATATDLSGVSCRSASDCTAAGDYQNSTGQLLTLAERWNGTSWTIEPTPSPSTVDNLLNAVSCASATECTAAGEYENASGQTVSLAEHWNGSTWAMQNTPNPPGATVSSIAGVSCVSAGNCIAVGGSGGTNPEVPLAEHWNGSTWAIQPAPAPPTAGPFSSLAGVSCTSATTCTAVGLYAAVTGHNHAFAEHMNNGTWTFQPTAKPKHKVLAGVACTARNTCTAVGYRLGIPETLAEQN